MTVGGSFRRGRYDREIFRLALPALGALAADPLVSLIDTAFVGRLGADALAGVAIAGALFAVVFAVFNFLEYAVTPLIATAIGAGRRDEAGSATATAFAIGAVAGILAAAVLFVSGDALLGLFGADQGAIEEAETYLSIRLFALPAVMLAMVGHGVFRGYQDTRTPLMVTLGLNVIHLVIDPILIFGIGMGVAGAATATVISQWIGALWFLAIVFWWRREAMGVTWGSRVAPVLRPLLAAGGRLVFRNASLLAAFTISTAMAARVGTAAVAAHQIAIQLWVFLALVLDALAIAGQAMVGKELGAGTGSSREISNRLLALGVLVGVSLAGLLAVLGPWLGDWFTGDAAVVAALGSIYVFLVLNQPLNAIVFVWDGVAVGAGAFALLAWSTFAAALTAVGAMAVGALLGLDLVAVWLGMTVLMLVRAGALLWWYQTGPLAVARDPSPASRAA